MFVLVFMVEIGGWVVRFRSIIVEVDLFYRFFLGFLNNFVFYRNGDCCLYSYMW